MIPLSKYLFEAMNYIPCHSNDYMTYETKNSSVKTEIQERFSCDVFNNWRDKIELLSIKDLPISCKNKTWLESFKGQCKTLKKYFSNWSNPVAVYICDDNEIGKALRSVYQNLSKKAHKENNKIDPSDIIIYEKDFENDILYAFNVRNNSKNIGNDFVQEFIGTINEMKPIYRGVSLKKGTDFIAKENNFYKDVVSFLDPEIIKIRRSKSEKTITLVISCKDVENNDQKYKVELSIRNKEDRLITIEAKSNKSSRIGNCPDNVYKYMLKSYNLSNEHNTLKLSLQGSKWSEESKTAINEYLKEDNLFLEKWMNYTGGGNPVQARMCMLLYYILNSGPFRLRQILLWCEKINENCVPYLLIEPKKQYI